jgi:hypothetical protein
VAVAVGADAVTSAGEPLGACYPAALTGVEVVHSCRNGAGVPLVRECNDICFRAKCNNICTQDFSLGSPVVCSNPTIEYIRPRGHPFKTIDLIT